MKRMRAFETLTGALQYILIGYVLIETQMTKGVNLPNSITKLVGADQDKLCGLYLFLIQTTVTFCCGKLLGAVKLR